MVVIYWNSPPPKLVWFVDWDWLSVSSLFVVIRDRIVCRWVVFIQNVVEMISSALCFVNCFTFVFGHRFWNSLRTHNKKQVWEKLSLTESDYIFLSTCVILISMNNCKIRETKSTMNRFFLSSHKNMFYWDDLFVEKSFFLVQQNIYYIYPFSFSIIIIYSLYRVIWTMLIGKKTHVKNKTLLLLSYNYFYVCKQQLNLLKDAVFSLLVTVK